MDVAAKKPATAKKAIQTPEKATKPRKQRTQAQKEADAAKARERRAAKKEPVTPADPFGDVPLEKRGGMALYD